MKFPVIFRVMGGLTLVPALGLSMIIIIALSTKHFIGFGDAVLVSVVIGTSICFITASFIWLLAFRNSFFFLYLCSALAFLLGVVALIPLFTESRSSKEIAAVSVFASLNILFAIFLFLISISATIKLWLQQLPDPKKEKFSLMWLLVFIGFLVAGPLTVLAIDKLVTKESEIWPGEITLYYLQGTNRLRVLNDLDYNSGNEIACSTIREQADGLSFRFHFDEPKKIEKIRIVNTTGHISEAYAVINNTDLKKIIFKTSGDTSEATLINGDAITDLEIKPTQIAEKGISTIFFREIHLYANVPFFSNTYNNVGEYSADNSIGDNNVVPEDFFGEEYYEGEGEGYDGEDAELGDGVIEPMAIEQYNSKQSLTNDKLPDFFKPGFNQWLDWKNNLMVVENGPIQINNNAVGTYYGGTASLTWLILPRCFKRYNAEYNNDNLSDEQCVQNYTGINPFISKSSDGKEINRVNPEIVLWATNNLIPEPGTVFYDYDVGDVYHKIGRRFFRLMALSHNYIVNSEGFEDDKKEYQEKVMAGNFEAVSYFRGKYSDVLTDYAVQDNYSKMGPPEAISFWLRRSIDGTEDELYAAVVKVLKTHDKEWYTNTIQK